MRMKSRVFLLFISFFFIFFCFNNFARGQANVSRSPNTQSISPRMAVDSAGNVHVIWAEYYTPVQDAPSPGRGDAFYAKYDINTLQWSAPFNLSNSALVYSAECRPVGIDVDGSNNVYVVYVEGNRIQLRIYSGGSWGAPFAVVSGAPGNCDSARIAVDSNGDIFTCWWIMGSFVVYSRARIGGTWENVKAISAGQSKFPGIAVGNNVAYCVWMRKIPPYRAHYTQRSKTLNAPWSAPQGAYEPPTHPIASDEQMTPDVAIDSNNIAHVVWGYRVTQNWQYIVQYSYWTGSRFSSPRNLSAQILQLYPSIHGRGNNLYVCWPVGAWAHGTGLHYANRINGTWSGEGIVPNSKGCTFTDVATSPDQSKVYYVWDDMGRNPNGTWEVWCNLGQTGPPPPPPDNPIASFTATPSAGSAPLLVTFDGSSSYDQNSGGTIVSYSWNFGDGATSSGQIVTHTYNTKGVFSARLTVTDNDGKTGSTTRTIDVTKVNEPPVAEFSFSPTSGLYPLQVNFDASASRDPDGRIVQYSWDFGDGHTGLGRVVGHKYERPGTFLIRLTVRDDGGSTATKSKSITVLSLRPPLNISWTVHADESLFQTRYVTEVSWEKNPANDAFGVQVVLYRIYRKKSSESNNAFRSIGEVAGDTYRYMDKKAGGKDSYAYTVTALDNKGHESPISGAAGSFSNPLQKKQAQDTQRMGKILRF